MKSNSFKSFARKNIVVIFLVMLCLGFGIGTSDVFSTGNIGGIVKTSSFLSASNIVNLTTQMAINAMLSAGLTYVTRKMLIDGYIIKVDYTEQKKLAAAVSRIATNINHVCRRINSTGHFYDADVAELKERMADVWELLKVQQRNEL